MALTRRILTISGVGIGLYLALSLYHGHQLRSYQEDGGEGEHRSTARAREQSWVQVNTTGQVVGPEQPPATQGDSSFSPPDGAAEGRAAPVQDGQDADLRSALERERTARVQAEELIEGKEAEIARLRAELAEARTRALVAEEALAQARLKADAMYRFGREQQQLLAPARQEIELLNTRLLETNSRLRQAEEELAALRTSRGDRSAAPVEGRIPPTGGAAGAD